MKNTSTYYKNPLPVDCVLEIRLCEDTWQKIKRISTRRKKSYSWVVRYSVFRMIKRKSSYNYIMSERASGLPMDFKENTNFYEMNKKSLERRRGSTVKHRHRLCLYGEDELYIRVTAARLRCTMTHLVRMALEKYLESLLRVVNAFPWSRMSKFEEAAWYWLGIKIHYGVEFPTIDLSIACFHFLRYDELEYW